VPTGNVVCHRRCTIPDTPYRASAPSETKTDHAHRVHEDQPEITGSEQFEHFDREQREGGEGAQNPDPGKRDHEWRRARLSGVPCNQETEEQRSGHVDDQRRPERIEPARHNDLADHPAQNRADRATGHHSNATASDNGGLGVR
jgi:hypothetical protein